MLFLKYDAKYLKKICLFLNIFLYILFKFLKSAIQPELTKILHRTTSDVAQK